MNPIAPIIDGFSLLLVLKVMIIIGMLVYVVFAFFMARQIVVMGRAITMKDDYIIRILGIAHFVFASLVLFVALLV